MLTIFLLPVGIQASGKIEARIGERVSLQSEQAKTGATYKWIVKKGSDIISTQTSSILSYTFTQQGEYDVNLIETDSLGNIKTTSVFVLVGERYPRPTEEGEEVVDPAKPGPLVVDLFTLPVMEEDGSVHLLGDGKVLFDINVTRSDVLEYRIDKNIFVDSDGNGTANDDVDNAGDDQYLLGGIWETEYKTDDANKFVAEVTLVTSNGEKAKQQVEIIFDTLAEPEGNPVAVLDVLPYPNDEDQLIYLYEEEEEVGFYARRSGGNIVEYRIDKNIFVDSDGDGNPENDIDNINDISFKTGDVWKTIYKKTDEQIIAQLIVVGEGGKGSRVQRGIWFTDKPKPTIDVVTEQESIYLAADKTFVLKGDPITFTVEGLPGTIEEYIYSWDFDGDGEVDKETEAVNEITHIYEVADIYDAKVTITDLEGNFVEHSLEVLVKDVLATIADFDFEVDGNTVTFTNKSIAALNLADKTLNYTWSFNDTDAEGFNGQKDQLHEENPVYKYDKAGTYVVTLEVTDTDNVIDVKNAEIVIENDFVAAVIDDSEQSSEEVIKEVEEGGSVIVKILKVIFYLILIVIVLSIVILGGFLVFLKVQHPDLTFEELVDEVKIKILGMIGVHDMLEQTPISKPTPEVTSEASAPEVTQVDDKVSTSKEGVIKTEESKETPVQEKGPMPDWLKNTDKSTDESASKKEIIEGELEEEVLPKKEVAKEDNKPSGDQNLNKQDGPTPDWLK